MKMNINKTWLKIAAVIVGFSVMIVYSGGMLLNKTPPDTLPVEAGVPLPSDATIIDVTVSQRSPRIEVVGTVASDRRIQLSARMNSYVDQVLVGAGDTVTNKQILVVLDQRELQEQLAIGEAQLNQAATEYRRTKQLFDREAATDQAVTSAESAYLTAKANVERIRVMLTYATITSPLDGIVTELSVEAGDLANPGQPLLGLYDPANMRMEVPVPVRLIDHFALGQKVTAHLDYPAESFAAEVSEIVGEIDPATRTRKVKMRLLDTRGRVPPGAFGRIFVEETPRPAIFIPQAAVLQVGQLTMVQVVRGERMVQCLIRTGNTDGSDVEVLSGLTGGDRIVLTAGKE